MDEKYNVVSQKRVSRELKVVPLLAHKARVIDLIGHCNRASYHDPYLGYKYHLEKKGLGRIHVCTYAVISSILDLSFNSYFIVAGHTSAFTLTFIKIVKVISYSKL